MRRNYKRYFLIFLITAVLLLTALSIDNILWITASPEWDSQFTVYNSIGSWTGPVNEYTTTQILDYVLKYRVYTVWTHPRDLLAAMFTGTLLVLITVIIDLSRKKPLKIEI
jgi:hypothetical protein